MKKFQISQKSQTNIMNATAIIAGLMLGCVICLFLQLMTYDKRTVRVANTDYVHEVTKWPGHTHVINIPVEYE